MGEGVKTPRLSPPFCYADELIRTFLSEWETIDGREYYFSNSFKTWNESKEICLSLNANLVSFNSIQETESTSKIMKMYRDEGGRKYVVLCLISERS